MLYLFIYKIGTIKSMVSGTCNISRKFQSICNISIRRSQDTCMIGFEENITWTISEDRDTCLWSLAIIHTRNNTNISFCLLTMSSFLSLNSLICRSCGYYGLIRSDIQLYSCFQCMVPFVSNNSYLWLKDISLIV